MDNHVDVLGVKFNNTTKGRLLKELIERIDRNDKTFIVTANPEIVMNAKNSQDYMDTLKSADYVIADGIGVIYGSRMLKEPLPERIPGFDLMMELLKTADQKRLRVFFLGARQEVIEALTKNVADQFPNLQIAGTRNGYFKPGDETIAAEVQEANADLIFVALGFPRQEYWIRQHMGVLEKGLFMGVGGSFDVLADKVKRAPLIWQKMNLEWLYRLIQQPSRWKRMLVLPLFLVEIWKEKKHKGGQSK